MWQQGNRHKMRKQHSITTNSKAQMSTKYILSELWFVWIKDLFFEVKLNKSMNSASMGNPSHIYVYILHPTIPSVAKHINPQTLPSSKTQNTRGTQNSNILCTGRRKVPVEYSITIIITIINKHNVLTNGLTFSSCKPYIMTWGDSLNYRVESLREWLLLKKFCNVFW